MFSKIDLSTIKGFFAGSSTDAFADENVVDRLLELTGRLDTAQKKLTAPVRVSYIGTATYDIPTYRDAQIQWFVQRGCHVSEVCIADPSKSAPDHDELQQLSAADIILASGGNTLYAVRRWEEVGLDVCLRAAASRGSILSGGSAGAVCWFTAGHSVSGDPSTYAKPMMEAAVNPAKASSEAHSKDVDTSWNYIRVHGIGILPGLLCTHHDRREGNGVLREEDFDKMLRRHPNERGIAIDHWAVLVLHGDGSFEVFAAPGKGRESGAGGAPHVYVKDVVDGALRITALERSGRVEELLKWPTGPIVADPFEKYYAMQNPTAKTERMICPPR